MPLNSASGWESETLPLIKITVQGYLTYKEPVGKRQVSLPQGSRLCDALACLGQEVGERFGEEFFNQAGELSTPIAVLLNGMHYRHLPAGLNTILKNGDQIAIFPPAVGG